MLTAIDTREKYCGYATLHFCRDPIYRVRDSSNDTFFKEGDEWIKV
jgi:hypothetical protein